MRHQVLVVAEAEEREPQMNAGERGLEQGRMDQLTEKVIGCAFTVYR